MEREPDGDELDTDEDAVSGMPEGEPELTPMGVEPDTDEEDTTGEVRLPGFPAADEPDLSG
ncbi:MAG: hypothetical protein M3401_02020 [Actinomycetota bacterium]|nr:hypothetical protein [Actinomycetota bacterium]